MNPNDVTAQYQAMVKEHKVNQGVPTQSCKNMVAQFDLGSAPAPGAAGDALVAGFCGVRFKQGEVFTKIRREGVSNRSRGRLRSPIKM